MQTSNAQEHVCGLRYNALLEKGPIKQTSQQTTHRSGLPFIDDFCYEGPYPDPNLWVDQQAYINNTFSATPITQGMATLDGLNEFGRPYFTNPNSVGYADSLTSQPIDISTYTPAQNLYFSFFYQPQGLGFAPEAKDSLMLFFKNDQQQWIQVWKTRGSSIQGFRYVNLPLADAQYFHNNFQFRFVNIASLDINNDTWNIDYIKLDANRTFIDSINQDVAFHLPPTSILYPYSAMPYRHFTANQNNEKAAVYSVDCNNLYPVSWNTNLYTQCKELTTQTILHTDQFTGFNLPMYGVASQNFNSFNISYNLPGTYDALVLEQSYYYSKVNATDRTANDTIRRKLYFDNYFAYDDGSAEKSYFLSPAFNYPAKTAVEFTLNIADSIRGLMVHFGSQLPSGQGKLFSLVLYKQLGGNGLNDSIIAQRDLNSLQYVQQINGFSSYAFHQPIYLQPGKYYIGITQPANFGSDSIYYGLDVNHHTNLQKLSYNVNGQWLSSVTDGSLMMRPIVGLGFTPTPVKSTAVESSSIHVYPNPSQNIIYIQSSANTIAYTITDISGQVLKKGTEKEINICDMQAGIYIMAVQQNDAQLKQFVTFIKQ